MENTEISEMCAVVVVSEIVIQSNRGELRRATHSPYFFADVHYAAQGALDVLLAGHVVLEQAAHVLDLRVRREVLRVVRDILEHHLQWGAKREKRETRGWTNDFGYRIVSELPGCAGTLPTRPLTVRSDIGGSTIVFSKIRITIFHSSLSSRFSTVFSQDCAYRVNEPSNRSINGLNTSSASAATAAGFFWTAWFWLATFPPDFRLYSSSPSSRTLNVMRGSRLQVGGENSDLGAIWETVEALTCRRTGWPARPGPSWVAAVTLWEYLQHLLPVCRLPSTRTSSPTGHEVAEYCSLVCKPAGGKEGETRR